MINQSKTNIDPNDQTSIRFLKATDTANASFTNPRLLENPLIKFNMTCCLETLSRDEDEGDCSDVTLVRLT